MARKLPKNLPDLATTGYAADLLDRNRQTIVNACRRWKIGQRVAYSKQKTQLVLSAKDLRILSERLQTGPGNPNWVSE